MYIHAVQPILLSVWKTFPARKSTDSSDYTNAWVDLIRWALMCAGSIFYWRSDHSDTWCGHRPVRKLLKKRCAFQVFYTGLRILRKSRFLDINEGCILSSWPKTVWFWNTLPASEMRSQPANSPPSPGPRIVDSFDIMRNKQLEPRHEKT